MMIRLEQIRLLENKITKAVKLIEMLREENGALKRSVDAAQKRMQELEGLVDEFKSDQEEIEKSLLRAIRNLDKLEDAAGTAPREADGAAPAAAPAAGTPAAQAAAAPPCEEAAADAPAAVEAQEENSLFDEELPPKGKKPEPDIF